MRGQHYELALILVISFFISIASCNGSMGESDPCIGAECSGHGQCIIVNGSAACRCEEGYVAVGLSCIRTGEDGEVVDVPDMEDAPDGEDTLDAVDAFEHEDNVADMDEIDLMEEPDGFVWGKTVLFSDGGGGRAQSGQYVMHGSISGFSCKVSTTDMYVFESCGIQVIGR